MTILTPPSSASQDSNIVDLTQDMSDLDSHDESCGEGQNAAERTQPAKPRKPKKKRKNHRGGKGKRAKEMGKQVKPHDEEEAFTDQSTGGNNDAQEETLRHTAVQGLMMLLGQSKASSSTTDNVTPAESGTTHSSTTVSEAGSVATEPLSRPPPLPHPKHPEHSPMPSAKSIYQMRPVSSADNVDKAYGLFANGRIEAGTQIICEAPLMTLPTPGDQLVDMAITFDKLQPDEQAKIWLLTPADHNASPFLTFFYDTIINKLKRLERASRKNPTGLGRKILNKELERLDQATEVFRLATRWHAARRSLVDLPEHQRHQIPSHTHITGLFIETAFLRHSCIPNCHAQYDRTKNLITVHTTRDITPDEELTLSALSSVFYQTASERADELQSKFSITCTCEACNPAHFKFAKHEQSRLLAYTRAVQLEHLITLLDTVDYKPIRAELCIRDSDMPDPDDVLEPEDLVKAESSCLLLIRNLTDTGCTGPEVIRWYNAMIDRICPRAADEFEDKERMRAWRVILRHAVACEEVGLRCFGRESQEYEKLVHKRVRTENFIAHAERHAVEVAREKKRAAEEKEREEKLEWEVVGAAVKKEEKKVKNRKGKVVGTLGTYDLVRDDQ